MKYNREGGEVQVALARHGDTVELAVRDTGIGLSEAEIGKLFGDFARIRNARTRGIEGSGLGLSTVKKIASLYGGEVSVHSEPERGSTFVVKLRSPAATASLPAPEAA